MRNPDHCHRPYRQADRDAGMAEFDLESEAPFQTGESSASKASLRFRLKWRSACGTDSKRP